MPVGLRRERVERERLMAADLRFWEEKRKMGAFYSGIVAICVRACNGRRTLFGKSGFFNCLLSQLKYLPVCTYLISSGIPVRDAVLAA